MTHPFIHLRVHSAYSLAEGAIHPKDLAKLCKAQGMPALAVTDTNNLFGALEFAMAAVEAGVQPIIGATFSLKREGEKGAGSKTHMFETDTLVLLAQTAAGYRNLMALSSAAFLDLAQHEPPHITWKHLEKFSEGLIALTGGPSGPLGHALQNGHKPAAETLLKRLKDLFPNRLYVEIQRHNTPEENRTENDLIDLAYAHDVPLVATNDVYFADESMYEAHDALLCIAAGRYVNETDRRRVTPEHRFKSDAEMRELFADLPEAIDNTAVIARRCSFLLKSSDPILPAFPTAEGRTEADELRAQARDGLEQRLETLVFPANASPEQKDSIAKPYRERLEFELDVIIQMKFPGYFLIVSDFIKWAKAQNIPVGPGRGSGAGSVAAWALQITDMNPLQFGLLFERFLNPERVSMPDFDIDFCQERRDEVIRYVQQRYGSDRVAHIITFGKLQARAVVRDVGRVLQMSYGHVDKICKLIPQNPANPISLPQALEMEPQLQEMRRTDEAVERLITIALKLEGLYRHASTHAAGVVIGDRPLQDLVALYHDPRSALPATQFNMKFVEKAGLVKFDFLGLKTLTVLQKAVELIARRGPEPQWQIDLLKIPLDDPKTYAMLGRGDATGVFQLESSGMRDVLKRMHANCLEDLIALVALYRPGPMDNIPKYINAKTGVEKPDYLHPLLEPILKETYGVMVYQEQVMQIAQVLAGYTLGGADLLRRAMGKKIKEEMEAQRKIFVDGAVARGVDADQAGLIFDQVNKFAGYGFNKSHAATYALIAYQTAYLKANFPVEFLAASMTFDMGNTDKLNMFRQELQRLGIKLLPPDINASWPDFHVEKISSSSCHPERSEGSLTRQTRDPSVGSLPQDDNTGVLAIRYALAAVKGVGLQAMKDVLAEREKNGPFTDLFDFARRLDLKVMNKRQLESLACAGAFDSLNSNRAQVFTAVETMTRYAHTTTEERASGQASMFSGGAVASDVPPLPAAAPWDPLERLRHEFEAIGFYLSAHPLDGYARPLQRLGVVSIAELPRRLDSSKSTRFKMAGVVIAKQERMAKSGNRFAFVQLSDSSGVFEVMMFSEILATARENLEAGRAVIVTVDAQKNGEDLRLTCSVVELLDQVVARSAEGIQLVLKDASGLIALKDALAKLPKGRSRISVLVETAPLTEVDISLPGAFTLSPDTRHTLRSLAGVQDVVEM
ncbi:MAG: DNA polymerase III subunit alpha [Pseudomonadota bacterium]|nr:DNA polymerase III subunit alpha [Pseudomonadota bacterium]